MESSNCYTRTMALATPAAKVFGTGTAAWRRLAWRQREALLGSTKVHTIPEGVKLAKEAMARGATPVPLGSRRPSTTAMRSTSSDNCLRPACACRGECSSAGRRLADEKRPVPDIGRQRRPARPLDMNAIETSLIEGEEVRGPGLPGALHSLGTVATFLPKEPITGMLARSDHPGYRRDRLQLRGQSLLSRLHPTAAGLERLRWLRFG